MRSATETIKTILESGDLDISMSEMSGREIDNIQEPGPGQVLFKMKDGGEVLVTIKERP